MCKRPRHISCTVTLADAGYHKDKLTNSGRFTRPTQAENDAGISTHYNDSQKLCFDVGDSCAARIEYFHIGQHFKYNYYKGLCEEVNQHLTDYCDAKKCSQKEATTTFLDACTGYIFREYTSEG